MSEEDIGTVESLVEGQAFPRDVAIAALGNVRSIAWWDMVEIPSVTVDADVGNLVVSNVDAIPDAAWTLHRNDYSAGGHGLVLENDPAVVGLFRYPDGRSGAVIGYRLAS